MKSTSLVIYVLGTTGVGKSKLAIELAKEYNGEIISSDSMQLYKDGGDITTNKVTIEEMQGIPHHMMSFLPIDTLNYNIGDYATKTIDVIQDIISRGKLPIVVGGTHYYTCSILWSDSILSLNEDKPQLPPTTTSTIEEEEKEGYEYSYEKLKEIDSIMAEKLHKNDFRKIKRSLNIYYTTGKKQSELISEQVDKKQLRYRSCLIWLECKDQIILEQRLNNRVDDMIKLGLLNEVFSIFNHPSLSSESTENFTKGLTQAIGIKELYSYYLYCQKNENENNNTSTTTPILDTEINKKKQEKLELKKEKEKSKLLKDSIDNIKAHTKRYAIRQIKWISKLSPNKTPLDILRLDSTDLNKWNESVFIPSKNQVDSFLLNLNLNGYLQQQQQEQKQEKTNSSEDNTTTVITTPSTIWRKYFCEYCSKELNGDNEWNTHQKSKQHRYTLKKRNIIDNSINASIEE